MLALSFTAPDPKPTSKRSDWRDRELHRILPEKLFEKAPCGRLDKRLRPPFVRTTTLTLEDIASVMGYGAQAPRRSASVAAPGLASAGLRLVH